MEANLATLSHHEFEYTHRGSPTSRSDLSMMFHGLPHHHDEHKDSLDIPHDTVITPVPHKLSQYKSDDSALYKMTPLPSESVDNSKQHSNFKTPTPLSSGLPPRKQFKVNNRITPESQSHHGDSLSHNLQQFKTDEKSDITDNHLLPNSLGNSGMSLSEMFDACLNSIKRGAPANTQGNLLGGAGKKDIFIPPFIQKSPQENTESTKLSEIPETEHEIFETRDSGELPEGARSPGLSAHDEWKNLNIEQEKKMKDFVEKLEGVLVRKFFKKWRHVPAVFQFQKYQDEDDFDLLHGKFEGIEGADYLDVDNKFTEDFTLKTGLITPIDVKPTSPIKEFDHDDGHENLLSERLSFYEVAEPEPVIEEQKPEKFKRWEEQERSSILEEYLVHKNLVDKENDDTVVNKHKSDKVQSNLAIASPRGNTGAKKQFGIRFGESTRSKIVKDKGIANCSVMKSPARKENPRKEAEKPKTGGARSSSIKAAGAGKIPPATTGSVRTSASNLKAPSAAVNKENNFVSKASPAKLKRTVSGASAGKH